MKADIWITVEQAQLLRIASEHEPPAVQESGALLPHNQHTLAMAILADWFASRPRYAELLRMREEARKRADAEWEAKQ